MSEDNDDDGIVAVNVGELEPWLTGQRPIAELREHLPFLESDAAATRYLDDLRQRLANPGKTYTTEEMVRELEKRRRARRAAA